MKFICFNFRTFALLNCNVSFPRKYLFSTVEDKNVGQLGDSWVRLFAGIPGLILDLRPANGRRRYKVTPPLIGWAQT